jgi:predicted nuclease of predicted toxin-antitoxin system
LPGILADENIPKTAIEYLRKKGIPTATLSQQNLKGAEDQKIAEHATKHNMTIPTLDTDFAQIYHSLHRNKPSIIVIKAKPATPTNITQILNATLRKIKIQETQNRLTIITKKRIRIIT